MRAAKTTKTRMARSQAMARKSMRLQQRAHVKAMNYMRKTGMSMSRPARRMSSKAGSVRRVVRKFGR
jgi:hypothetical protein